MLLVRNMMILGPANAALQQALNLPVGATVADMVAEIERLKNAAAEGKHMQDKMRVLERERRQRKDAAAANVKPAKEDSHDE